MKIRYIVSMSGAKKSYPAFEKDKTGEWVFHEVEDVEALRMVELERAVPKDEKEHQKVKANIEEIKAKKKAQLELSENIKNLDELRDEKFNLTSKLEEVSEKIEIAESAIYEAKAKEEAEAKAKAKKGK